MKRRGFSGNQCFLCCTQCVPCTDNYGQAYMGCPRCVIIDPVTLERIVDPSRRIDPSKQGAADE